MKRYTKLILALAVFTSVANFAFADGNAFTPLNFDDTSAPATAAPKAAPASAPTAKTSTNPISNAMSKVMPNKKDVASANLTKEGNPIGNEDIQNAILQLDNAQVGIRNDLLNYKAKYADVDAQYKLIKNERNMLHKQVVTIERRIKNIDRAKEKIRKNMI